MTETASVGSAPAGTISDGIGSSRTTPKLKRRKSLTQSIRARLSRQSSRDSVYTATSGGGLEPKPPVPSIPASYSTPDLRLPLPAPSRISAGDLQAAWSSISPPSFPSPLAYTSCYCEENIYLLVQHLSSQLTTINRAAVNIATKQSKSKRGMSPDPGPILFVPVWDVHVAFISNAGKTVLLYQQKASKLPNAGWPVIWDYHVIALTTCHLVPIDRLSLDSIGSVSTPTCFRDENLEWGRSWVYDFDSRLSYAYATLAQRPRVVPWTEYKQHTFLPDATAQRLVPQHFQPMFRVAGVVHFLNWFASDRSHMRNEQDGWNATPPSWECVVGEEAGKIGEKNNLMRRWVSMSVSEGEKGKYGRVWDGLEWLQFTTVPIEGEGGLGNSISGGKKGIAGGYQRDESSLFIPHPQPEPQSMLEGGSSGQERLEVKEAEGEQEKRGGRIASPLFPAYLHASQSHRSLPPPPPAPSSPPIV